MNPMAIEIRFEEVSFSYRQTSVLRHVTVALHPAQTVTVVGKSGCGKSTFLKLINGLLAPQEGSILLDQAPIDYAQVCPLRRKMGYVMQEAALFPHLTVKENLVLLARLDHWAEEAIEGRVRELLRLVNLEDPLLPKYPSALSGGQRQRIAIARALFLDPPILLMDEPFSALDPITRKELQDEFIALKQRLAKTVVMVTHDFAEALRLGDRAILLSEGQIHQDSPPWEFITRPKSDLIVSFTHSFATLQTLWEKKG